MTKSLRTSDRGEISLGILTIVTVVLSAGLAVVFGAGVTQVMAQTPEPVSEPLVNYDGS